MRSGGITRASPRARAETRALPEVAAQLRQSTPASSGFARAAAWGSRWATFQSVANKIATMLAMLIVARMLEPGEYGLASLVNTVVGFVMIMPVVVMADVLISHQRHLAAVARAAWGVALAAGIAMALLLVVTAPWIASRYDQYSFRAMAFLLAFAGARPIAEALLIFPWTRLRLALRFRDVAIVNGLTRFGATILMVAWAVVDPGAEAIVVPQILMTIARAIWFSTIAGGPLPRVSKVRSFERRPELLRRIRRRMRVDFMIASLAQYVHAVTGGLALVVASRFVSTSEVGQFAFAMTLAPQFVGMFTVQVGAVLQPIFGRLKSDPFRQVAGFHRATSLMGAIVVPVSLIQAALAEPGVRLLFGAKWLPAVPILIVLSIGTAVMYLLPTTLSLLKAQGRFGLMLVWQAIQAIIYLSIAIPVASEYGALGVAIVDTSLWSASLLVAAYLAMRVGGVSLWGTFKCLATPWAPAIPIAGAAWLAAKALPSDEPVALALGVLMIGPAALFLAIVAIRVTQPGAAADMAPFVARIMRPIPFAGPQLAHWFASAARDRTPDRDSSPT